MARGSKRKTTAKSEPIEDKKSEPSPSHENTAEETNAEVQNNVAEAEPSKNAAQKGRRKKAKVVKPETEPEYFPEKRNLVN